MKRSHKIYIMLVTSGILLMSLSFAFQHYAQIPDIIDGVLKGTAIGLILLGIVFRSKEKMEEV